MLDKEQRNRSTFVKIETTFLKSKLKVENVHRAKIRIYIRKKITFHVILNVDSYFFFNKKSKLIE